MDGQTAVQADALMDGWYLAIVHREDKILWWDIIYSELSYNEIHTDLQRRFKVRTGNTSVWSFINNRPTDISSQWSGWPGADRGIDAFDKIEEQAQRFGLWQMAPRRKDEG